jgi:hypothetical protein
MSILVALQVAVNNKLNAELSVPVYSASNVPDNAASLYVTIGNDTHIPWDTDGLTGWESTLTIHSWDTDHTFSYGPVKTVMGAISDALHRQTLTLTGYNTVGIDEEFAETKIDADGRTRHGVQRFRLLSRRKAGD